MQVSEHFDLREFICPEIYQIFGEKSLWFIDRRIINVAEAIMVIVGKPITINNWHLGGQYRESGLRSFNTATGGKYSQHKYGNAIDPKCKGMSGQQLFNQVQEHWDILKDMGLTTVENPSFTKTWLHADCRETGLEELLIVNP